MAKTIDAAKPKAGKKNGAKVNDKVDDWYGQLEIGSAMISIIEKRMVFWIDGKYHTIHRFENMFNNHGAPKINHLIVNLTPDEIQVFKGLGVDVFDRPNYVSENLIGKMLIGYIDGAMYTHIEGIGSHIGFFEKMFDKRGIKIEGVEIKPTHEEFKKFKMMTMVG